MAVLTAIWFVQIWLAPVKGKARDILPNWAGCWRVAALIISTVIFAALVESVGFTIMMFVFLLFLLIALGRQNVYVTLSVSLLGSFGIYYVFTEYLNVHLPASPIELFLRSLGN
jgi:putative tricarboxylic transport membrane protein